MSATGGRARILVIRLGALGDFVQSLGPFAALRRHHRGSHIVLLTTAPYAELGEASGCFDEVWIDDRPALWNCMGWLTLRRRLRAGRFDFVYDLQTSDRSGFYFRLFGPGPKPGWSGVAPGCSHPHANPRRDFMHSLDRQAEQLRMAGVGDVPAPALALASADIRRFDLPESFVLLVPGGAAHRPAKRWPVEQYAALARHFVARGVTPVVIGGANEAELARSMTAACPEVRDLSGQTGFLDIVAVARVAAGAVGNDTGPMHLIATAGCPAVVLFSRDSDPALCAPRGADVTVVGRPDLAELTVETVVAALRLRNPGR